MRPTKRGECTEQNDWAHGVWVTDPGSPHYHLKDPDPKVPPPSEGEIAARLFQIIKILSASFPRIVKPRGERRLKIEELSNFYPLKNSATNSAKF